MSETKIHKPISRKGFITQHLVLKQWIIPVCVSVVILTALGWWTHTTFEKAVFAFVSLFLLAIVVALFFSLFRLVHKGFMETAIHQIQRLSRYAVEEKIGGPVGGFYEACQDAGKWSGKDGHKWLQKFRDRIHVTSREDPPESSQKSLIIVEHETDVLMSLSAFFEDEGFIVYEALTSEKALHILSDKKIDFGIIDLQLPRMDGINLILTAHILNPNMQFVICTELNYMLPHELLDIGIGPQQVFAKRFLDINVLARAINNLTGKKRLKPND